MLDWLVVGGGIHGTHVSHVLTQQLGVPRHRLRVVDPHPSPLYLWLKRTAAVGMQFLRSSMVHHLDVHPFSLKHFASSAPVAPWARFAYPYKRPSLSLFNAHCQRVVDAFALGALRLTATVERLRLKADGTYLAETSEGVLAARRVVLAIGSDGLHLPAWAETEKGTGRIVHAFEPSFHPDQLAPSERIVVVGGGITAAQVAMACSAQTETPVVLIQRHAPRIHQLDSDPGWMGPRHLLRFHGTACFQKRRAMIDTARYRGSMPPQVYRALRRALRTGRVEMQQDTITSAHAMPNGVLRLRGASGATRTADRVVLATGFAAAPPGGSWLTTLADDLGLPCAPCGFPVVAPDLAWRPGLHVTGALAELEVGPVARNIVGARLAADRLLAAA